MAENNGSPDIFQLYTPLVQFSLMRLPRERRREAARFLRLELARRFISARDEAGMVALLQRGYEETSELVEMCRSAGWGAPIEKILDASLKQLFADARAKRKQAEEMMRHPARKNTGNEVRQKKLVRR